MRYFIFLLLSVLLISCQEEERSAPDQEKVKVSEIQFAETEIALIGDAQRLASEWEAYTTFQTAFENYDHSVEATQRLATLAHNLRENMSPEFDNQPIRSRILVLETRLNRYASFLGYTNKPEELYTEYYGDIIRAFDDLNGQLNEKSYVDDLQEQLIEELKSDLRDLDGVPNDSIAL
ncbi:hypothetical protein SAMN05192588_1959 [Nonlabens sp. Hel1_33_55]|uniref:hypothetical protein n=1 Tax=Nonlabens sp. Hel1_33_55 TaxID=1336802 RepID=UPI000875C7F3|nr:hypothetical protein [Nonlabens sp. Hel1_33_55]SCY26724.1 hypothetical protein SAMN05192588_1959 [Nonlabens sp. Hel1_33_55]